MSKSKKRKPKKPDGRRRHWNPAYPSRLNDLERELLAALPKDVELVLPGLTIPELAETILGKADKPSCGIIRRAIARLDRALVNIRNSSLPYSKKDHYSIKTRHWPLIRLWIGSGWKPGESHVPEQLQEKDDGK